MMSQIKINVSGTIFEVDCIFIQSNEFRKLSKISEQFLKSGNVKEIRINRPAACFNAILTYYQTGQLHMPTGLCPGVFQKELEFWEVEYGVMQDCCLYKYQTFLDDEKTRKHFLQRAVMTASYAYPVASSVVIRRFHKFRERLWRIIDNNENSIISKIYFYLVFCAVLMSIIAMAYSTEPSMRRPVSECEMIEYMEHSNDKHAEQVKQILGDPDCSSGMSGHEPLDIDNYNWNFYRFSWGWSLHSGTDTLSTNTTTRTARKGFSLLKQILREVTTTESPVQEEIVLPELFVPRRPFYIIDYVLSAFFTLDLMLRLISCPSVQVYFRSVINILDILALICCFIYKVIVSIEREYIYLDTTWILFLDYMQVLRTLRLFRVVKNVRASRVLAYSLTQDVRDMSLLVLLLIVGISTFACLFYFSESRDTVPSIPNAWYWAVVTMTTVGYGDISPETGFGRLISSICAVCGVLLLAVTLPMFVNNFLTLYQYSCVNESIEKWRSENKVIKPEGENKDTAAEKVKEKSLQILQDSSQENDSPPAYYTAIKPIEIVQDSTIYYVKEADIKQQLK